MSTNERNAGTPERNLWAAVILNAYEYINHNIATMYFFREGTMLSWICYELGYDIDSIKRRAEERYIKKQLKHQRKMEVLCKSQCFVVELERG